MPVAGGRAVHAELLSTLGCCALWAGREAGRGAGGCEDDAVWRYGEIVWRYGEIWGDMGRSRTVGPTRGVSRAISCSLAQSRAISHRGSHARGVLLCAAPNSQRCELVSSHTRANVRRSAAASGRRLRAAPRANGSPSWRHSSSTARERRSADLMCSESSASAALAAWGRRR